MGKVARRWLIPWIPALGLLVAGCATAQQPTPATLLARAPQVTFSSALTVPGLGAAQGAAFRDGYVYLYGDAKPGVIRQFRLQPGPTPGLLPTGIDVPLTLHGQNLISHPTGLAHNPGLGTFLGNTVARKGSIYLLDWPRLLADGNLDHAVLNCVDDDLAVNGSRPEFVRVGGRWLLASCDYGDHDNRLRLYDPRALAIAKHTSDPGVLVASFPCGTWVQNLHWIDELQILVVVQNQIEGRRWRLTFVAFQGLDSVACLPPVDFPEFDDELEGFILLPGGEDLAVTSTRVNNIHFGAYVLTPDGLKHRTITTQPATNTLASVPARAAGPAPAPAPGAGSP